MSESSNLRESRLERAVESTSARAFTRFVVPVLLLAILGWLSDVRSDLRAVGTDVASVKSDIRNVNTRLDERVIRQVDSNTQALQAHERRLQVLERAVHVP